MLARKIQKPLALLLAVILTAGLLPTGIFAYDENQIVSNGRTVTTDDGRVQHSKMITQTGVNAFDITLTVKTQETVDEAPVSNNAAVVLMFDASNSMSRADMNSARDAARHFVDSFVLNAGDGQRKVAVVEFGSNGKTVLDWTEANGNVEAVRAGIDSVDTQFAYRSGQGACNVPGTHTHEEPVMENFMQWTDGYLGDGHLGGYYFCTYEGCNYTTAFSSSQRSHNHQVGTKTVTYPGPHGGQAQKDSGGTNLEAGLRLANNLLGAEAVSGISHTYVVLMTDGVPSWYVSDGNETDDPYFINGSRGGGDHAEHSDYHDIYCSRDTGDNIPQQIKNKGAKLYTISYKAANVRNKVNGQEINDWLASFSTQNISAGDDIFAGLANIADIISNQAKSWIVTDPMGDFIRFGENSGIPRVDNATAGSSGAVCKFNTDTGTLSWDLKSDSNRRGPDKDGWYTYSLTYSVTLDTANPRFDETQNYPANKTTALTYMLSLDGQLQPALHTTELVVPVVRGKTPVVPYAVEYYKRDKTTGEYPAAPDDRIDGTGKLWTAFSAPADYLTRYSREHYQYVSGDTAGQLTSLTENLLRLYYDPQTTSVTVNHFYKEDVIDENGVLTAGRYPEAPQHTVRETGLYVGDRFEASLIESGYTPDAQASDARVIASLAENGNVINLYYSKTTDRRAEAGVTVYHVYNTYAWQLNAQTGRMEKVLVPGTAEVFTRADGLKATDDYQTPTAPKAGCEDYAFAGAEPGGSASGLTAAAGSLSLRLGEGENTVTLTFEKDIADLDTVPVTVNHHYKKTVTEIQNGKPSISDAEFDDQDQYTGWHAGERFTAAEKPVCAKDNGLTYVSDPGNAAKLTVDPITGAVVIDLYYTLSIAPDTASVTVNHIYQSEITNADGETTDVRTDSTVTETFPVSGLLYAGQDFTATEKGLAGYAFESAEPGMTVTLAAAGNVINLYYIKDDRDDASIAVTHTYITHATVASGSGTAVKSRTDADKITVDEGKDKVQGRAGDAFTPTAQPVFDGSTYTLTAESRALIRRYTLHSGTNDTVNLVYERSVSELSDAALTVTHHYRSKTMFIGADGKAVYPDEWTEDSASAGFTVNGGQSLPGSLYAGQTFAVDPAGKDGYTFSAANEALQVTLKDGDNHLDLYYDRLNPLAQVPVTVTTHYEVITIGVNGEKTTAFPAPKTTNGLFYRGETVTVQPIPDDFPTFVRFDTHGRTAAEGDGHSLTFTADGSAQVDYYYQKTVDQSQPVSYTVNHYYRTLDWNEPESKPYGDPESTTGRSFATLTHSAAANCKPDSSGRPTYALDEVTSTPDFVQNEGVYTITLQNGVNQINFYYTQRIDTRLDRLTTVTVNHNYYGLDTANPEAREALEGSYSERLTTVEQGAWIGNVLTAALRPVHGEGENARTYVYRSSTPDNCTLTVTDSATDNVITINYLRTYDSSLNLSVVVNHRYFTLDRYTGVRTEDAALAASETFGGAGSGLYAGQNFTAAEKAVEGYRLESADPSRTVTLADGVNTITLSYLRTVDSTPDDPSPSYAYYRVTVKYLEEGTGTELHSPYTSAAIREGLGYDVTGQAKLEIEGYSIVLLDGDPLSGVMNGNKTVIVYYVAEDELPDPDVPLNPASPSDPSGPSDPAAPADPAVPAEPAEPGQVIVIDPETPLGDLPKTGVRAVSSGTAGLLGSLTLFFVLGCALLRRREDTDIER